ncbi:MAG: hypothetical protein A3H01_00310 [Candidatus Wildermuthbacteria bacterium RIFCSPLOWO2_12_FULL_40_9]|uniref:FCP1 homology domain-containing protein n=2 Tax=Candidatus Wildermuthiibacteriota TaxID=1817923 RepID=A0A1G2RCW9_9BACT|nr:MAG: hypothetical protein A3F15_02300 [Candidatus Wildermuthbacteria bacterium RIFCSPHIGHO2_12_FULL_40_12]OHA76531.1 MAG: hypothetical protein A3H01_00310 [Candidatus Wildermuthbacteria bacterium RIFCSPLOWO2_12_FULL_40_9]
MIKAVIFDLGKVLVGGNWKSVHAQIARKIGVPINMAVSIIQPIRDQWSIGNITEKEFWEKLESKTKKRLPKEFKKNIWFNDYIAKRKDVKESWQIASELKKRGYRLAILSNTTSPHVKANRKIGRFKRLRHLGFKVIVLSCEVGYRKPEPKIYKITLKRLKLSAKECVFIDDRTENIRTAKKLGIKSILFENSEKLRKDLIRLKLL